MTQRIVDLTHTIEPTGPDAQRKFVIHKHNALLEIPGKLNPRPLERWAGSSSLLLLTAATRAPTPSRLWSRG